MAKLTDTQLIVLSKAAAREDGAGVFPSNMNRAAAAKVGTSLLARKLMRTVKSRPGLPIWRDGEDSKPISLVISRAGRDAIGVDVEVGDPVSRQRAAQRLFPQSRLRRRRRN